MVYSIIEPGFEHTRIMFITADCTSSGVDSGGWPPSLLRRCIGGALTWGISLTLELSLSVCPHTLKLCLYNPTELSEAYVRSNC